MDGYPSIQVESPHVWHRGTWERIPLVSRRGGFDAIALVLADVCDAEAARGDDLSQQLYHRAVIDYKSSILPIYSYKVIDISYA